VIRPMPTQMYRITIALPRSVSGATSPYPTVVMVMPVK